MCVLAHLCDEIVVDILKAIDKVAQQDLSGQHLNLGVIVIIAIVGIFVHQSGGPKICQIGNLNFYSDYLLTDPSGRYKGFTATKS